MRGAMRAYEFAQGGFFAYQLAIAEPPPVDRSYYLRRVKEIVEQAEDLVTSEPEFLHQRTERSFIYLTRAFREGLKAKGPW